MDMSLPSPEPGPVDAEALAEALGTLGLLYGARAAVAGAAAEAGDEAEAVRKFIRSERPHLLATYELETIVALVLAARRRNARPPASIEAYSPS